MRAMAGRMRGHSPGSHGATEISLKIKQLSPKAADKMEIEPG